jgi:hypothetical protein
MQVQYVTDGKGKTTAIQLSVKQWKEFQKGMKKLELLEELKQAVKDMKQHEEGNLSTPTTKQLLSQL